MEIKKRMQIIIIGTGDGGSPFFHYFFEKHGFGESHIKTIGNDYFSYPFSSPN